jgi:hypothetical protein
MNCELTKSGGVINSVLFIEMYVNKECSELHAACPSALL